MRATRQPIPVLRAATGRRSLAALIAIAVSLALPSATPAMSPHSWAQFVLGQLQPKTQIGKAKNPKKTPTTTPKKDTTNVDPALLRDKAALPLGYKVPPEPLPDVKIVKELPFAKKPDQQEAKDDPELTKKWREHQDKFKKYTALLRRGTLNDPRADKEILRYGIQFRLAQLTQQTILFPSDEEREKVATAEKRVDPPPTIERLRDEILKDLDDTNAFNDVMDVRDAFLDILCEEAPKLLDNNFYVRFSIAEILSSVNNRDANHPKGGPEVPGFKAIKALLDLVNDAKQHPLYKLHPVQALARICRHKDCKPEDRFAIIDCLIKQMTAAKKLPEWYGMRVAESLGHLGEPNDRARQPVVVEALVSVLKDQADYKYRVRVQAAHSLGRVPLEGYKKSDEIAVEILRMASQMAQDYEKDKTNPRWKLYFAWLYMAFHPMGDAEKNEKKGLLAQVESKPVLAGTKTVVTEAYQLFLPLAQEILGGKPVAAVPDQLRKIKTWLDARGKAPGGAAPVAVKNP